MRDKKGLLSLLASLTTSLTVALIFYILARDASMQTSIYTDTDIAGGVVFVFILSMIISASIWPGIIQKRRLAVHEEHQPQKK